MSEEKYDQNILQFIIVLDDDLAVPKIIKSATACNVKSCTSLNQLHELLAQDLYEPVAVFVDIHIGLDENGLDIIPILKSKWPYVPIIVISGTKGQNAIGDALSVGGDDFVYKPINTNELVARMQVRCKQLSKLRKTDSVHIGDLVLDFTHRTLQNDKGDLRYLSPSESTLLTCLIEAEGTVVKRKTLKRRCWGQIVVSDNALNRKLHEVRNVVKEISETVSLRTIYGIGFTLSTGPRMEKKIS